MMKSRLRVVPTIDSIAEAAENPLLRGIPDPKTDKDLVRLIAHDPFRDPKWTNRSASVRLLPDALQSVFVPTPGALRLAWTLFEVLHNGYDRRDPRKPGVWADFHQPTDGVAYGEANPSFTDGLAISGITGLGKSHQVCRVLSVIPQTIYHDNLGGRLTGITQIVWIYLDMNTASGLEALLLELLEKIDDLLGIQVYRKQYEGSRVNIDRLINTVIRALKTHFCGMLVLDEVQRLNFGLKQASERVRNLMLKLLNVGIPVVLVGNPLGLQFKEKLGVSGQLIRRLKANGYVRLNPADSSFDEEWLTLVRGLWRCQILPERTPLSVAHLDLLYRLTGGFPKFLSHLLAYSQQRAIAMGEKQLSLELIEQAAHTSPLLQELHPLINAFVTRDALELRAFSDVDSGITLENGRPTRQIPFRLRQNHPCLSEGRNRRSSKKIRPMPKPRGPVHGIYRSPAPHHPKHRRRDFYRRSCPSSNTRHQSDLTAAMRLFNDFERNSRRRHL